MGEAMVIERVKELLESISGDDANKIQEDINKFGDAEVDSIHFIEIAPFIKQEFNINVTPNHIDKHAKRSFNDFCNLIIQLVSEQGR